VSRPPAPDGVLVVDKPAGMSSAAVVSGVKRALGATRVGHAGTLDPMATGVLPVVLGEGTKLATFLLADDKEYEGELELGVVTDTLDADGAVLGRSDPGGVTREALLAAMGALTGPILQVPPMHSALKQGGRRLYELAREGIEVDRPARPVRVDRFDLLAFDPPRARFVVACSKGTYVRSLVRDVGEALGCGATLTALRRTRSGIFGLDRAIPLEDVAARGAAAVVPPAEALAHLPAIPLDPARVVDVRHGRPLPAPPDAPEGTPIRLLGEGGALLAVAERRGARIAYLRVFHASG
jgi:tRNA pseudouridine55 synthase